jgi:hypothetical protein
MSARLTLDKFPKLKLVCIDHWKGSIEHQQYPAELIKNLYETFLVNCWEYRSRLIPVREYSLEGLEKPMICGLKPGVVYIDASHQTKDVINDTLRAVSCYPRATIVGDDYTWKTVESAVAQLQQITGRHLKTNRTAWALLP